MTRWICGLAATLLLAFVAEARAQAPAAEADPTKQTDADWMDDRWQRMDHGQFLGAAFDIPGRLVPRGIAIKVGENDEGAVCFDTDLMRYSAMWTGGFIQTFARRYGLIIPPKPAGTISIKTAAQPGWARGNQWEDPRPQKLGPLPNDWARYRGIYRSGKRVVLSYLVGDAQVLDSPWLEAHDGGRFFTRTLNLERMTGTVTVRLCDAAGSGHTETVTGDFTIVSVKEGGESLFVGFRNGKIAAAVAGGTVALRISPDADKKASAKVFFHRGKESDVKALENALRAAPGAESLRQFCAGGPPRWGDAIVTKGTVDRTRGPLAIDTITIPFANKYNALFFTSGHDFFANGDAAVATVHGDVWRVSGLDSELQQVRWTRYATGLYQPLGLKILGDRVHVLERDQITILHDVNGDNEADWHQNLNNEVISAGGGHSYATCLETDTDGNFYFVKCAEGTPHGGAALRVSADGSKLDVIATGFRNPNGLGVSPSGMITVADQQGDWVPETRLDVIKQGGFYGFMPMHHRAIAPTDYDRPLVWVPRAVDNSAGGQVWIPQNQWGPLGGKMIHLSYGRCTMMAILHDTRNPAQGAVVPLPGKFLSGAMRARFNTRDNALYVSGLRGWQTAAVHDGCFQRVRYTGAPLNIPVAYTIRPGGLDLTFSTALAADAAVDAGSFGAEQWNYKWSEKYGSPDYSIAEPDQQKRDTVAITGASLLEDGKTVRLQLNPLKPAMQFRLTYNLEAADGKTVRNDFYATIHSLGQP